MFKDKLGCYKVGNLKFYSKLEAIEMHTKTGIHPHWDFNEAVFSSYDWTKEPTESILELYKQRAEQIREKYDYIILLYSGGSDSETVLQSFIDNDIKLDEIATTITYEATASKDHYLTAEYFNVSGQRGEKLKTTHPWMKHTVIDVTKLTFDFYQNKNLKYDWIYDRNMFFSPSYAYLNNLPFKIKEWADIINSGKKLCLLWGHDKPRILHENNRFSFRFLDLIDNGPQVTSIAGKQHYTDELFFWSPDLPKLLIKQAHLVKNYLTSNLTNSPFITNNRTDLAYKTVNGTKKWLNNHGMHRCIYPNWNIDTFSAGKPGSIIFSDRDDWFWKLDNTHKSRSIWQAGVDKIWSIVPDYWKNNPADLSQGLKACWSKDYFLE